MWVERFSEIAKDDPLLAKIDVLAADTKLAGNKHLGGYAIHEWLSVEMDNGHWFWLSEFFVQLRYREMIYRFRKLD